ncbi:MAG: PH domain-containing protein [Jatrophihabitans sp.]|uniref:PH domain-containing protein n=1 Tax=Jatrophihabitans sp. TaxID=1932789 RepID=UPI00390D1C27
MAYPEKILANDEKVVEHLHPHWITLVPATLWFIVLCAAGGFGLAEVYNNMDSGTGRDIVVGIIVVVGVLLLCWLTFAPWIRWRTTHYVFTSHRVLIRRGVFTRTGRDIALQRINDVGFSQSLWDRLVGAGTLTIESAGEQGQEQLTNVPNSDQMQQRLNRLIEEDGDRRTRPAYGQAPQGYPQQGGLPPQQGYPQQQPSGQYPQQPPYPPTQNYPPQ